MMYERPEIADAHKRFWQLIRHQLANVGIDSPDALSQDAEEFSVWLNPELVLSQTCGMPYRLSLHDKVNLVGTPDYGIDGCSAGYYCSPLVVRADDPRKDVREFEHSVLAFNQPISQSGYAAIYWHAKKHDFWFNHKLKTGQHLESAKAVAEGTADIASIDAVTWRFIQRYEHFAGKLQVLEWTDPTPGLPLITALRHNPDGVFTALSNAFNNLYESDKMLLGIKGFVKIPANDYLAIANPPLPECVMGL
ncbi:MAG: ABC-type phosphate/phosphonate transport system substrate-binding protein [Granulosicoccus sp.]|jgi:ABC-type phosphate/phosphonate transport system substrate-binding protein